MRRKEKNIASADRAKRNRKSQSDDDGIWAACPAAQRAAALRKAEEDAELKSAALQLGRFALREDGRWACLCTDCGKQLELGINVRGDVQASSYSDKVCPNVSRINQWLHDNGFRT